MLRLGYKASAEQFGPTALLEFSCLAEQVGFDSVFVSDHFQPWKHTDGHAPSALAWLGALGARTQRVVIGTSVLTPTFRYHPSIVAQVFGTLGRMFPGRVSLGVGTGESLNEVPATGMKWPDTKERFARLREAITPDPQAVERGPRQLRGRVLPHRECHDLRQAGEAGADLCRGRRPAVAKYAGRSGDGFICTSGKKWDLYTETLLPNVAEGIKAAARPKPDYDRMIEMKVSFDTDRERARQDTRHWAALALTPEEKVSVEDPREMEKLSAALPVERAESRWIVSTDPDEHVEKIRPYVDLGFRHLVFHAPGPDQARFLKLYGEQVLPRLRRAFA